MQKTLVFLTALLWVVPCFADGYRCVKLLQSENMPGAEIKGVKLLQSKMRTNEPGHHQMDLKFGIATWTPSAYRISSVEIDPAPASFNSALNPTDNHISLNLKRVESPESGPFALEFISFELSIPISLVENRSLQIHRFSFSGADNRKQIYKLDLSNPLKPRLIFIKTYIDVEGQTVGVNEPVAQAIARMPEDNTDSAKLKGRTSTRRVKK